MTKHANANPPKDLDDRAVWEQGRQARWGSISKEDAPYDPSDANYKLWVKGWESADD